MRSKEVEKAINDLMFIVVKDIYCNEIRIDKTKIIKEYNESVSTVLDYVRELEEKNYEANNIINNQIELLKDSTSNSVIRDKMEELNKQIENELLTTWLEAKIEVLKELLESEK